MGQQNKKGKVRPWEPLCCWSLERRSCQGHDSLQPDGLDFLFVTELSCPDSPPSEFLTHLPWALPSSARSQWFPPPTLLGLVPSPCPLHWPWAGRDSWWVGLPLISIPVISTARIRSNDQDPEACHKRAIIPLLPGPRQIADSKRVRTNS